MMTLPPGPTARIATSMRLLKDTIGWEKRWREQYGDPFSADAINGRFVMTGRPELVRELLKLPYTHFAPFGVEVAKPVLGHTSLLVQAGERHKRDRKLLMPPFHGTRMRAYGELMHELVLARLDAIEDDAPFSMLKLGQDVALDVIVRAVFGVEERERLDEFGRVMADGIDAVHPIFLFAPMLQRELFGVGPWARFMDLRREGDRMLRDQIARTRARATPGEDILSLLLAARYDDGEAMPDDDVIDQLRTLLIAGHETSAIAMAWAMYFIHRDADVRGRLLAELDGVPPAPEQWVRLPYLKAVVDEALRIHPIVPEMARTLTKPWRWGEYDLEPGFNVAASAVLLHSNPDVYEEPDAFRPERFLDKTFGPHENLSFGFGNRRCIGAAFAHYEIRIALATILLARDVELLDDEVTPARRSLTFAPDTGVRLRVRRRAQHAA
jgi:cytochrome P450